MGAPTADGVHNRGFFLREIQEWQNKKIKSCKSWSKLGSETKPCRSWFRSRPIRANIYTDVKTHVALGEDAYQKRAVPSVPVDALIPYIYVLPNNSFIDFIKERQR